LADEAEAFREALLQRYRDSTGIAADAWICDIGGGAAQVSP
jgi:galactokinase